MHRSQISQQQKIPHPQPIAIEIRVCVGSYNILYIAEINNIPAIVLLIFNIYLPNLSF